MSDLSDFFLNPSIFTDIFEINNNDYYLNHYDSKLEFTALDSIDIQDTLDLFQNDFIGTWTTTTAGSSWASCKVDNDTKDIYIKNQSDSIDIKGKHKILKPGRKWKSNPFYSPSTEILRMIEENVFSSKTI